MTLNIDEIKNRPVLLEDPENIKKFSQKITIFKRTRENESLDEENQCIKYDRTIKESRVIGSENYIG